MTRKITSRVNERIRGEAPKTTRSHGAERRHELVSAAYDLIATKGFEGLRVRDVAERCNVNIATLHYYFPSKEALVQAVVDYLIGQFRVEAETIENEGTALQRLQREMAIVGERLKKTPEIYVVLMELQLRSIRDPVVQKLLKETSRWQDHIQSLLREGVQQGVFRSDLDAAESCSLLMALIKGLVIQEISGFDKFDFARVGAHLEALLGNSQATSINKEKRK